MSNSELLTEKEVEPLLRLKLKTIQQMRQLRRGPRFVKLGRRVFYRRQDIDEYIASNVVHTGNTRSW
jgi:predicted DNA-binding transcriptional regulator AlpA